MRRQPPVRLIDRSLETASASLFDRLRFSAEIWRRLVKDFGKLFSVVAGQPLRIDEHRSKTNSRRYRTRRETRELLATV